MCERAREAWRAAEGTYRILNKSEWKLIASSDADEDCAELAENMQHKSFECRVVSIPWEAVR